MVKRALNLSMPAKYLLMDSWFGFPALVRSVMEHIHVICMVKNTSKVYYELEGQSLTLSKIYRMIKKRRGKAKIKGSMIVGKTISERNVDLFNLMKFNPEFFNW